jgi:putative FmdB family regulatory protein
MPIYEYHCIHCSEEFERLELSIKEIPVSQCPNCQGAALKIISAPAVVFETVDTRLSVDRLPTYHQKNKEAKWHDAWQEHRRKNPVPGDKGSQTKVYESEGLKQQT